MKNFILNLTALLHTHDRCVAILNSFQQMRNETHLAFFLIVIIQEHSLPVPNNFIL